MKFKIFFLIFFILHNFNLVFAQKNQQDSALNIGSPAPPLQVTEWIKGSPVQSWEKGHVYVLDFWAPYCEGCIKAMPKHSSLAKKYKGKATIIGIDAYNHRSFTKEKIRRFIDSMGNKVNYTMAFQDSNLMETLWLQAMDEPGIPKTIIINSEGLIAWIGHPNNLDGVLKEVIDNKWNLIEYKTNRDFHKYLEEMDYEAGLKLIEFRQFGSYSDYYGQPDSVFSIVNEIVSKQPELKYTPEIAFNTFSALLKTDMKNAYDYAIEATRSNNPLGPSYFPIIGALKTYSDKLSISAEIYKLGAETMLMYSDRSPKNLMKIAEWFWRAGDKSKAMRYNRKAIRAMRKAKVYGNGWFH